MSLPAVNISERDGAIGVLPAGQRLAAFIGPALAGPTNLPATFARTQDIVALFTGGPLVEMAAHYMATYSKPCVIVRTGNTTAGAVSSVASVATGTSVVATAASPTPKDDFEVVLRFAAGGTRGEAGATYQLSFDGGRTYGPIIALGTDITIVVTEAGFTFTLAAGTFVAGDTHTVVTTSPNFNAAELASALDALRLSAIDWEGANIAGPLDASSFAQVETKFSGLFNAGKYCYWVGGTRMPAVAESEATYLASLAGVFGSLSTKFGGIVAGSEEIPSAVSGRVYRRPPMFSVAALQSSVSEEVNIADPNLGSLPGVLIRDSNGNPKHHDEAISPGLDDARFITLRTIEGYPGVYITRPRLFSAPGSDFQIIAHRRVLNLAHIALRQYFTRRLNAPVLIDRVTGRILEREAKEIEAGARAAMRALLMAKPKASGIDFTLSRVDDILATRTLTGQGFVTPLGYPEQIDLEVGFYNPVNAVAA